MKQRISRDLVARRYSELLKSGLTKEQATMRTGQLVLNFYGIAWVKESMVFPEDNLGQ